MATASIDEDRLKDLLKSAMVEVFEERRDLMRDLIEEVLEDVALAHAIEEGERSETVSRSDIGTVLNYYR